MLWTACALPSLCQNSHSGLDPLLRLHPLAKGARHCNVSETSSRPKLHSCVKYGIQMNSRNSFPLHFLSLSEFCKNQSQASFTNDVARLSVQLEDLPSMHFKKRIQESRNLFDWCRRISEKWRTPGYSKHSISKHRNSINTWVFCFAWVTDALNVMRFSTLLAISRSMKV